MISITIDASTLTDNLEALWPRIQAGVEVIGNATAQKMEAHAKTNAKWQNRTGAARGGLTGKSTWQGTTLDVAIFHTVDYGLWLEIRDFPHAGRLAILEEARDSQVNGFTQAIKSLF